VTAETHVLERLTASNLFLLMWDDYGWSSDIGGLAILDGTSLLGFHLLDRRAELTEEHQEIDLPAEVLERYVGVYQLGPQGTVTVTRTDGGLVAEATGLGIAPIYPATETEFFVKAIPVELTFQLGPHGVATGVVVRFAGRQIRGSKIR
jgi:D-alanyl-D-alanine-carboxypeptidase/D-alanyl-D-alanine-endopeptidase